MGAGRRRHPNWWGKRLSVMRGFARYLQGLGHEVPPTGMFPTRPLRATPYLYGEEDIARLMVAARLIRVRSWGRTMEALIGLLAVTGMRIGEVVQLDVTDIDWAEGLLTVRSSKFGKSREAPRSTGANDLVPVEVDSRSRNTSCPWSLRA